MSTGQFFAAHFCAFRFATFLHKITPQKNCRLHRRYKNQEISMSKLLSVSVFLLAILTFPAQAEVGSKIVSVEKMFAIIGIDEQFNGAFEAMLPTVDQLAARLDLDSDEKEELKNIYRAWFHQDIDRESMKKKMVDLYAGAFSQVEIEEITKFYQTPAGQKFLQKSPELMKLGGQIGMQEGQKKQQQLINRLTPFIEKHKE